MPSMIHINHLYEMIWKLAYTFIFWSQRGRSIIEMVSWNDVFQNELNRSKDRVIFPKVVHIEMIPLKWTNQDSRFSRRRTFQNRITSLNKNYLDTSD